MKEEKNKHAELQNTAIRWLYNLGCSVFAQEVPTQNGIADAVGIRKDAVYYIEAKASRSDLMCRKQKLVYLHATGAIKKLCYYHDFGKNTPSMFEKKSLSIEDCTQCKMVEQKNSDTGIDFYYLILADGVKISKEEYPMFGVINEEGRVIRRGRRMKKEGDNMAIIKSIAHVLVYKVFGKLYQE